MVRQFWCMRTAIRLAETHLRQVERKAMEQGKIFTAVVEDAPAAWSTTARAAARGVGG